MKLNEHPFFANLPQSQSDWLQGHTQIVEYDAGEIIFEAGSLGDSVYLVLDGDVEVASPHPDTGALRTINTIQPGKIFGELAALRQMPRAMTTRAQNRLVLGVVPGEIMRDFFKDASSPVKLLLENLGDHLTLTTSRYVQELMRQEKMALVGSMMNGILHDFKNPLCLIQLAVSCIKTSHIEDKGTQRFCDTVLMQIRHMVAMAEEVMLFSRDRLVMNPMPVSVGEMLGRFQELNALSFENKHVAISIQAQSAVLCVDEDKVLRLLQNLVDNAIEAIEGMSNIDGLIAIQGRKCNSEMYELKISDNGCGIPEEIRSQFFEPFITKGKKRGTGLGSAIAKNIATAHGGELTFVTEMGKGTTFTLTLPLHAEQV